MIESEHMCSLCRSILLMSKTFLPALKSILSPVTTIKKLVATFVKYCCLCNTFRCFDLELNPEPTTPD